MFELPPGIPRRLVLLLVAFFFTSVGVVHFTNTEFFVSIMPPYLPWHVEIVYISGVFEILGGLGVLVAPTRKWAGYGLLALLVAVFPANIHMAMNPELFPDVPEMGLYIRLPIQFLMAWCVWFATAPVASASGGDATA
jgi:uncharacterized membrane protein